MHILLTIHNSIEFYLCYSLLDIFKVTKQTPECLLAEMYAFMSSTHYFHFWTVRSQREHLLIEIHHVCIVQSQRILGIIVPGIQQKGQICAKTFLQSAIFILYCLPISHKLQLSKEVYTHLQVSHINIYEILMRKCLNIISFIDVRSEW